MRINLSLITPYNFFQTSGHEGAPSTISLVIPWINVASPGIGSTGFTKESNKTFPWRSITEISHISPYKPVVSVSRMTTSSRSFHSLKSIWAWACSNVIVHFLGKIIILLLPFCFRLQINPDVFTVSVGIWRRYGQHTECLLYLLHCRCYLVWKTSDTDFYHIVPPFLLL